MILKEFLKNMKKTKQIYNTMNLFDGLMIINTLQVNIYIEN